MKKTIIYLSIALIPVFCACRKDDPAPDAEIGVIEGDSISANNLYFTLSTYKENTTLTVVGMVDETFDEAVIPPAVLADGKTYSVTNIGNRAFDGCAGLTNVTIPPSITSIGYRAFADCKGLKYVILPESVVRIENEAFAHCSGLVDIHIPNSVTGIGSLAFFNCSRLTSITLSNSMTRIGALFVDCTGLTSVVIPESITSIGNEAFQNCNSLARITIPGSVTSIGERAFWDCWGIRSISIPPSVASIGKMAFAHTYLKMVEVFWEIPIPIDPGMFGFGSVNTLFVPPGTKHVYAQAENWNRFPFIVEK